MTEIGYILGGACIKSSGQGGYKMG